MSGFPLNLNFTPDPEEHPDAYHWGRHHRAYLKWSAERCRLSLKELAACCGYRKIPKFDRRRRRWNEGKGRIPLGYLEALSVDLDLLGECVELDQREHDGALQKPRFAHCFVARVAAAVYVRVELAEGTSEEEAVGIMKEHATTTGRSCLVNYPGLLVILVSPNGNVATKSLEPELQVADGTISFGNGGDNVGVMRVGRGESA